MGNCCRRPTKDVNTAVYVPMKTQAPDPIPKYDMAARQEMAASTIQRQTRRAKALKVAKSEQQWKVFADLDTQDEAEMLHLAVFMQTLLDFVPSADKFEKEGAMMDDDEGFAISPEDITLKDKVSKSGEIVTTHDAEYEITQAEIDGKIAEEIIELYRKGGKLSRRAVVKILRKAYKMLQNLPNTTYLTVGTGCKLTVVGDLHGQLSDLFHILDSSGIPNKDNKFIFNGDFVDRGISGIEVVCTLLTLFVAFGPEIVCLNRGNHEDLPVCRVYGFENEVKEKYDELLFEMFAEVFNYLPLFAVANDALFVVHGGLFHTPKVTLDELEEIQRYDYYVKPPVPYPQNTKGLSPEDARAEFCKQLQRDALWSDPTEELGCYLNPRGAGVSFGPDIARIFMETNHLSMVIRSHECCQRGFDLPYAASILKNEDYYGDRPIRNPRGCPLLCTLFSASNYVDGDNEGAFMIFMNHAFHESIPVNEQQCDLHYTVKRYKTSESTTNLEDSNKLSLTELIMKKKTALSSAFEAIDIDNLGIVSRIEWAEVMQRITQIKIRWLSIITTLAPEECLSSTSVAYRLFLDNFSVQNLVENRKRSDSLTGSETKGEANYGVMDDMYGQRKKLETVFYYFDTDNDGVRHFASHCMLF